MQCRRCKIEFDKKHFNEKYCTAECKRISLSEARKSYKQSPKGREAIKRWYANPKKKILDKKYMQTDEAKKLAVQRVNRHLASCVDCQHKKRERDVKYGRSEKGRQFNRAAKSTYNKTEKGRRTAKYQKTLRRNPQAGRIDFDAWNEKLTKLDYKCQICGTEKNITVDHIIPMSKGGTNHIENLQPLCVSCNCSKGNRIDEKYSNLQ